MKDILFITLSNIGDAIMTTPTLERLHQLFPEAQIDLVCDPRSEILFEHCPYRGKIFLKLKQQGKRGLFHLIRQLRKKRYDLIVDLRTDGLAYLLRSKKRLTKWRHQPYGPHAVEDLISIIHPINPEKIIPQTTIWLSQSHRDKANTLTQELVGKRWLGLGPGANWPPKVWAAENFAQVANALQSEIDSVIILGGPADSQYCAKTMSLIKLPVIDLSGKTDLLTASALLQQCLMFIGNDSGLGHLASAVDTTSITVFGPGRPERYHPWHDTSNWLSGRENKLENIELDTVIANSKELLALT